MPTEHDPFAPHDTKPTKPAAKTSSRRRRPTPADAQPAKGEQMVVKPTAAKKTQARKKTPAKKTPAKKTAAKKSNRQRRG